MSGRWGPESLACPVVIVAKVAYMSVYYLDAGDLYIILSSGTRVACMSSRHLMAIVLGLGPWGTMEVHVP